MMINHPSHHRLLTTILPQPLFKMTTVQIKNLEVVLLLVAANPILVVENLNPSGQVMNLLLLPMIHTGNLKVMVVGAGAGAVVVLLPLVAVVEAVLMIGTVRLPKPTPTRNSIKAGVVTMATPNSRQSKLPL
jgi:hypothetical protein